MLAHLQHGVHHDRRLAAQPVLSPSQNGAWGYLPLCRTLSFLLLNVLGDFSSPEQKLALFSGAGMLYSCMFEVIQKLL